MYIIDQVKTLSEGRLKIDEKIVESIADLILYSDEDYSLSNAMLSSIDKISSLIQAGNDTNRDVYKRAMSEENGSARITDITKFQLELDGSYTCPMVELSYDQGKISGLKVLSGDFSGLYEELEDSLDKEKKEILNGAFKWMHHQASFIFSISDIASEEIEATLDAHQQAESSIKIHDKITSNDGSIIVFMIELTSDMFGNAKVFGDDKIDPLALIIRKDKNSGAKKSSIGSYNPSDKRFNGIQSLSFSSYDLSDLMNEAFFGKNNSVLDGDDLEKMGASFANYYFKKMEQVIRHEVMHMIQHKSYSAGGNFGTPGKNPDGEKEYFDDDYEFYTWVEEVYQDYVLKYSDLDPDEFRGYVADHPFTKKIKELDNNKFKKAVAILYKTLKEHYDEDEKSI